MTNEAIVGCVGLGKRYGYPEARICRSPFVSMAKNSRVEAPLEHSGLPFAEEAVVYMEKDVDGRIRSGLAGAGQG